MIAKANTFNRHGERCRYHVLATGDLSAFPTGSFDLVYCVLVLQHMPPAYAEGYIREFLRVAEDGATVIFQVPDEFKRATTPLRGLLKRLVPATAIKLYRWARYGSGANVPVQMNAIPEGRVRELVSAAGGEVLDVDGIPESPLRYWVRKKRA